MKRFFKNFHFAMLGVSILCILLGLAVLLRPYDAMLVLCYGFGGVLILAGLLQAVSYLVGERSGLLQKLMLLSGILSAVLGVWVLFSPQRVGTLTMIVLGIVLLYHGAMDVKYGFDIKKCEGKTWGAVIFFGIATCAVGVLILVDPFEALDSLFFAAGLGFLFDGVTDLFTVFTVAGTTARYERLAGSAPVIELEPGSAELVTLDESGAPAAPAEASPTSSEASSEG